MSAAFKEPLNLQDPRILERQAHTLHPGGWAVESERPVATILGSCVAVCLYDPKRRLCGMNHFLLPKRPNQADDDPNVVLAGDYAMEVLVNAMLSKGCRKQHLVAKAFGGGTVVHSLRTLIGENNARFARQWLECEGIPLVASDLGGNCSRKVIALPEGDVFCRRMTVPTPDLDSVVQQEIRWQERTLLEGQKGSSDPMGKEKRIELF